MQAYMWTKKLDDIHYSVSGEPGTLCGKPMLGSNYARGHEYKEIDTWLGNEPRTVCAKCSDAIKSRNLEVN